MGLILAIWVCILLIIAFMVAEVINLATGKDDADKIPKPARIALGICVGISVICLIAIIIVEYTRI